MTNTVAAVQMDSREDREANLETMIRRVDEAASRGADLVAFPELSTYMGPKNRYAEIAETIPGDATDRLGERAAEHGVYVHAGSFIEHAEADGMYHNASALIDPSGEVVATYRKIHLFDVTIGDDVETRESAHIVPGDGPVVAETDLGTVGLSVCYDLRFPELYASLSSRGATVLFVPAAFTMHTGKDHWEPLLRARAIENQAYVVAPGQIGEKTSAPRCYGRSMVVDPWGNVVARASDREGIVYADLDPGHVESIRRELPSLDHRRAEAYDG